MIALAFSLVHTMAETVDNSNRAYALANCVESAAIAIAFQIVMILTDADTIVPDNVAVAMTASCVRCVTYALAIQLVVSVIEPLSDEANDRIAEAWSALDDLVQGLGTTVAIGEVSARLMGVEAAILQILVDEGAVVLPSAGGDAPDGAAATEPPPPSTTGTSPTTDPTPTTEAGTPTTEGTPTT